MATSDLASASLPATLAAAHARIRELEGQLQHPDAAPAGGLAQVHAATLQMLLAALPDTIVVLDARNTVVEAKAGNTPLLPDPAVPGQALAELLPAQAAATVLAGLATARQTQQVAECRFELLRPDQSSTYHLARAVAQPGGRALLMLTNVTAEEVARQELTEQQQFIEQVLDTSPSPIYVRDAEGQMLFQNRAMAQWRAQARHSRRHELDPASVEAQELLRYAQTDAQVLAQQQQVVSEDPLTLASGEVVWFQTVKRPFISPDGTVHVLGVSTDITAAKLAQQQLERNEKQYRNLMEYSQALICTHDLEGRVLSVNPAVARFMGLPLASLPGRNLRELVTAARQAEVTHYLETVAQQGRHSGVMDVRLRQGEQRYLLYNNLLVHEAGQHPYIIGYGQDITERILAEREMKRAKEEAEAAARARANFLANMSHEIRTPLNGVLGMAARLAKTPLDTRQHDFLRIIQHSGQHLLSVINDVLDMAKISSGKLELEQVSFNLCDSMSQALRPLVLQAQEKGLRFEGTPLRESCALPWVLSDPYRLNQILINLVANAIKFTEPGGRIAVMGRLLAETEATLTVEFSVQDTGIGIAPSQQARIFEGFTQAYTDTTRRYGGTGLGLSICRALIEQLGGTLTLHSVVGEGSTFTFQLTLPRAAVPKPQHAAVDAGALRGRRVLLVEDNEINREVARLLLEEWGVLVDEAPDGPQGLALYERHPYDVVLMDIQMPGMNGMEAAAAIRRLPDPAKARVPILALTANAFRADNEQYLAAGMNACLAKPFEEMALYSQLEQLLRPAPTAPSYDLSRLQELARGQQAFVQKIIRSFLSNIPRSLAQLQQAATAADWQQVAQLTHHIKPNLESLGVPGVAEAVQVLERGDDPGLELAARHAAVVELVAHTTITLQELPQELLP